LAFIELDRVSVDFPVFDSRRRSLRNALISVGSAVGRRVDMDAAGHVTVHALKSLSLRIDEGDRIGLIGRNGSGKSTLLRLLAGVYEPTAGTLRIQGSCCPLLDITLGVDVEASGYDNILLRGLALGMTRKQVKEQEAEIAAFTELGDHLNLPVRTYSSGMLLRLAFAVSTSLSSDILVIDEVIGAGDATFMSKAKQRLETLLHGAKILVIASHVAETLRQMCNKGLYMRNGEIIFFGAIDEALALYAEQG
jgi:ABC-2 type transport system ATP-binding protein/lipopolysaccharide transport system ATP-binding protein